MFFECFILLHFPLLIIIPYALGILRSAQIAPRREPPFTSRVVGRRFDGTGLGSRQGETPVGETCLVRRDASHIDSRCSPSLPPRSHSPSLPQSIHCCRRLRDHHTLHPKSPAASPSPSTVTTSRSSSMTAPTPVIQGLPGGTAAVALPLLPESAEGDVMEVEQWWYERQPSLLRFEDRVTLNVYPPPSLCLVVW